MYQIRNGQRVVPTCPECGCRLRSLNDSYSGFVGHFQTEKMGRLRDAQGHTCQFAAMAAYVRPQGVQFWSTGPYWNPLPQNT